MTVEKNNKHIDTGNKGELAAKNYLLEEGYTILETNWRYSRAEVDIIAKDKEDIVFVEVKTRSTDFFERPEEAVTPKKQALLASAAEEYLYQLDEEVSCRFDVIAIIWNDKEPAIHHITDAFYPFTTFD